MPHEDARIFFSNARGCYVLCSAGRKPLHLHDISIDDGNFEVKKINDKKFENKIFTDEEILDEDFSPGEFLNDENIFFTLEVE